jgi:hypothetical protein
MFNSEKSSACGRWLLAAILLLSWSRSAAADTARDVRTSYDALASTAAVVEGSVTANVFAYDAAAGPRTVASMINVTPRLGTYRERTLDLSILGGQLTDGRWVYVPELPHLTDGTRYLVFLTNSVWLYSPVVTDWIFRLEPGPRGDDVLITPTGHLVQGLTANGLELSSDPVIDTGIDFLRPFAPGGWINTDPALLASGMSKTDFLAALQVLARTVPPQGSFLPTPDTSRVWNRWTTAAETRTATRPNGH